MLPVLSIGPLSIPVPGLVVLISIWTGLSLSERLSSRYGVRSEDIYNLIFIALTAGLVGARVSFLASVPNIFLSDPLSLFALDLNMFDPVGGFLIAVAAALISGTRKDLEILSTLDAVTPFLAAIGIGLGFSHLASGSAYGTLTDLPWGITLWGAVRHPTQIYEILGRTLILAAVWPRKNILTRLSGLTFFTFTALTAGWQLLIAGFVADSEFILSGLRSAQVVSWLFLAGSLWVIQILFKTHGREHGTPR